MSEPTVPDLTPEKEKALMDGWLGSVEFTDTPDGEPKPDADDPDDDYATV